MLFDLVDLGVSSADLLVFSLFLLDVFMNKHLVSSLLGLGNLLLLHGFSSFDFGLFGIHLFR